MSFTYYLKKAVATVFNKSAHPMRGGLAAAVTMALPAYMGVEAVLEDPSSERAPGFGARQAEMLDQSLTETIRLARENKEGIEKLNEYRLQQVVVKNDAGMAATLAEMEQKQDRISREVGAGSDRFLTGLLLSSAIAETDARSMLARHDKDLGVNNWGVSLHGLNYLDECQKDVSGSYHDTSYTLSTTRDCMVHKVRAEENPAVLAGTLGFLLGGSFLTALMFSLGRRYRYEVESEDAARARAKREPAFAKQEKVKEATLKIKISQP